MKRLDEINSVVHLRICLKVEQVLKNETFFAKNSQKTIKRSFFVDFNIMNEFLSKFYIINRKQFS